MVVAAYQNSGASAFFPRPEVRPDPRLDPSGLFDSGSQRNFQNLDQTGGQRFFAHTQNQQRPFIARLSDAPHLYSAKSRIESPAASAVGQYVDLYA